MRDTKRLLLLLALGLGGCSSKPEAGADANANADGGEKATTQGRTSGTPCDVEALEALAESLGAAPEAQRVQMVAKGLLSACKGGVYPLTEYILEAASSPQDPERLFQRDPQFEAARLRICPDAEKLDESTRMLPPAERVAVVFRDCDFQRFEVIAPEEVSATGPTWLMWTTHAMMLDDGASPDVAKTISRALIPLEQEVFAAIMVAPREGQELPAVTVADRIPDGIPLYVSMTEVYFLDKQWVALTDGTLAPADVETHLIKGLYDPLMEEVDKGKQIAETQGRDWEEGPIVLVLDRRLPFSTLVDVLYTTGRAGYSRYSLVVEPGYPARRAIHFDPPTFGMKTSPLKVLITIDGFRVVQPGEDAVTIPKLDAAGTEPAAWDLARLKEIADSTDAEVVSAVVSAEKDIAVEILAATYAALLGPECEQAEAKGCRFPTLMIEAGAG